MNTTCESCNSSTCINHCFFCQQILIPKDISDIKNCTNCQVLHYIYKYNRNFIYTNPYLAWLGIYTSLNTQNYEIYININSNGNPSDFKIEICKYTTKSNNIIFQSNSNINITPQNVNKKLPSLLNLIPFS